MNQTTKKTTAATWAARIALALLLLGAIWGGYTAWKVVAGALQGQPTKGPEQAGSQVASREPDQKKTIELAEELAARVAYHESLPAESVFGMVGLTSLGNDKKSNEVTMGALLDSLAREIGATKAVGAIRAIKENRDCGAQIEQLARSTDPATQDDAKKQLGILKTENADLEAVVRESLAKEGMDFTPEQVKALCASPNAEDTASMISAFGSLKQITAEMERRLRIKPSQDQAQKYYGAHCAMLMALDKVQKRAIQNIEQAHIPKAEQIRTDSVATAKNAVDLLKSNPDLSQSERQALIWNTWSCKKTVEMAQRTEEKLQKNLAIIQKANEKLEKSIATAQNCHMTALLQKEIMGLETSHAREIARLEALTVPELAAINFADPENIEMSLPPPGARP